MLEFVRLENNLNPNWVKILFVESNSSIYYPIRIAVYDDNPNNTDKLMAEANFEITDLYESPGNTQYEELSNGAM